MDKKEIVKMNTQILYISSIPWNYAWHRQQEMVSKLAEEGFEILFVEPCTKRLFKSNLVKKTENVWVLSPSGLPYERVLRCVNAFNAKSSKRQIKKALKKIGFSNPIVWLDRVHGFDFKHFSKESYVVYDLIDEILAFGRVRNNKMLISLENKVLRRADLLVSSSQTLLNRKTVQCGGREKPSKFIPNGVDVTRFESEEKWQELKGFARPIIGFIGTISQRSLDYELIGSLATRNKEWNFVFVGPGTLEDKEKLKGDNVFVFDKVDGSLISKVINSFDVGIIPYVCEGESMDYVFPRKACEFLAAGKPVVATPLNELGVFGESVFVANGVEEFEKFVRISLEQKNLKQSRRDYVRKFDWNVLLKDLAKGLLEIK